MDPQEILRWLISLIALLLGVIILSLVLKVAGFLIGFAIKAVVILLLVAIVFRFVSMVQSKRR